MPVSEIQLAYEDYLEGLTSTMLWSLQGIKPCRHFNRQLLHSSFKIPIFYQDAGSPILVFPSTGVKIRKHVESKQLQGVKSHLVLQISIDFSRKIFFFLTQLH